MNEFVFLSWRLRNIWNLKSKFKFQVFPNRQDRKTNSLVRILGEVVARQFFFKIYWPLNSDWNLLYWFYIQIPRQKQNIDFYVWNLTYDLSQFIFLLNLWDCIGFWPIFYLFFSFNLKIHKWNNSDLAAADLWYWCLSNVFT